jgi:hypothetical protein
VGVVVELAGVTVDVLDVEGGDFEVAVEVELGMSVEVVGVDCAKVDDGGFRDRNEVVGKVAPGVVTTVNS